VGFRHPNPNRIKIHRNYTVEEAARVLGVHKNTIRRWIAQGLPIIGTSRPILILGSDFREFLTERRKRRRQPCPPGHLYCVRCRAPRKPDGGLADLILLGPSLGNLRGICPTCESLMHRRVSLVRLHEVTVGLEVMVVEAEPRLRERPSSSSNCDFTGSS